MPDGRPDQEGLFSREARHREDLLTEFEEEWREGVVPDLAAFVRRRLPPWLPRRDTTIAELIRVDQEFRIKRGEQSPVEHYCARLGFQPDRNELLDLVVGEFVLRSRFQSPPSIREYGDRFPDLELDLRRELSEWTEATSTDAIPELDGVVLHVVRGPHRGMAIRLSPGRPLLLGRADSADVRLAADWHLSRFHVRFELSDGRVLFQDMNSANGTTLNDVPATEGELCVGDLLRCGESTVSLESDGGTTAEISMRPPGGTHPAGDRPPVVDDVPGYELCDLLGRGTLGVTYAAVRLGDGADVAVKWIDLPHAAAKTVAAICEADAVRPHADPALLLPLDIGIVGHRPYVVTSRHRPVSFDALVVDRSPLERLPIACRVIDRVLTVLAPLHAAGFVHGDVKASNVLLELARDGLRVKVVDFGLARQFERPGAGTEPADDVFAVGRLLRRFVAADSAMRSRSELPTEAEVLLARAADLDPAQRFAAVAEFLEAIRSLRASLPAGDFPVP